MGPRSFHRVCLGTEMLLAFYFFGDPFSHTYYLPFSLSKFFFPVSMATWIDSGHGFGLPGCRWPQKHQSTSDTPPRGTRRAGDVPCRRGPGWIPSKEQSSPTRDAFPPPSARGSSRTGCWKALRGLFWAAAAPLHSLLPHRCPEGRQEPWLCSVMPLYRPPFGV